MEHGAPGELEAEMSLVGEWIGKVLFTRVIVTKVADVAPLYRIIELEGPELAKSRGAAGDKIQVRASSFAMRTYTPIDWDLARGRTRICAYVHGDGPGANWAGSLREGDACSFFGPRTSLALAKASGSGNPVVLFGDETSVGVAASLSALHGSAAHVVLETASSETLLPVLKALSIDGATSVERKPDGSHLRTASAAIAAVATRDATVFLTGNAKSIVAVRAALREAKASATIKAKAYWAEGKTGLD